MCGHPMDGMMDRYHDYAMDHRREFDKEYTASNYFKKDNDDSKEELTEE